VNVLATADLHWSLAAGGDASTRRVAREAAASGAGVLVVAGDVAAFDPGLVTECLALFEGFTGPKLVVPGNHDIWTEGKGSWRIYREDFPRVAREADFHCLDGSPVVHDGVGFVGSLGWYDYSFADPDLEVPEGAYAAKMWREIGFVWNDGHYARWRCEDGEVVERMCRQLEADLAALEGTDRIVAAVHHLPFEELLFRKANDPGWTFGNAFMGSGRLGEVLKADPRVGTVLCGHSHTAADLRIGPLRCINVGSTYLRKRLVSFEA